MSAKNSSSSLQDNRSDLFESLRELDPSLRYAIGLVCCAVVAYYIPSIIIALTGLWVNNLTMLLPLLISATVLVVQNLIGNRLNKILICGLIFAGTIDCGQAYSVAHYPHSFAWHVYLMLFFFPTAACILNAWLFLRFKTAADLH